MAKELILNLKIDGSDTNMKLKDTEDQMKKIKKSTDDTSKSLSLADTKVGKLWTSFKSGAIVAKSSMSTLKGAIAATGIGLLVIAFTSLVQYFNKTEEGANKLKVIMAVLGQVMNVLTDVLVGLGEGLVSAFENPQQSIKDLWELIKTQLINRVTGLMDVYTNLFDTLKQGFIGVAKSVAAAFSFGDKKDKLKAEADEAFKSMGNSAAKVGESMVQTLTGVDNFIGKVKDNTVDLFNKVVESSKEAADLQKRTNQLAIDQRNNLTREAKLNIELAKAKTLSDDATLSQEDKLNALNLATKIQNKITNEQIRLKREEYEIQKQLNTLSSSTVDDKLKEAQLEAELINLTADGINKNKELETKKSVIIQAGVKEKETTNGIIEENYKKHLENLATIEAEANQTASGLAAEQLEEDLDFEMDMDEDDIDRVITKEEKLKGIREKAGEDEMKLKEDLANAAISIAQKVVDTSFGIQQNKLKNERETELAGANLTEKEKEKINQKYAKKQKDLDLKKAIVNGVMAIGKTFATLGYPAGIPAALIAAASTVAQIATIKNTKYQTGGFIKGNSHANGGVNINAEKDEYIVNARSMRNPMIAQEVIKFNNLGNAGVADSYQGNGVDSSTITRAVIDVLGSIPVTVTENQITKTQSNVKIREERFTQN